jgi:hypothetical protein
MKQLPLFQAVLVLMVFAASPLLGQSLPDVPLDEEELYRNYERAIACGFAKGYSLGDRPVSRETFIRLLGEVSAHDDDAAQFIYEDSIDYFKKDLPLFGLESDVSASPYFWEPITTLKSRLFFLDSPLVFRRLENSDGENLEEGLNHFFDLSGRGQVSEYFSFFYQVQLNNNRETNKLSLKKGYGKLRWKNIALKAGRDSIWWGPSIRGVWIISNNPREFDMIQLRTEAPFRLPWIFRYLGEFRFDFAHLWLDDDRRIHRDPRMLAMRASYMPFSWFEVAVNRTTTYGGSGRPEYSSLSDWWKVITGVEDRVPGGEFNNQTLFGHEISVNLSFLKKLSFGLLKGGRLYREHASPDVTTPWQKGFDKFNMISESKVFGIYVTTGKTDFRFERAKSDLATYLHGVYRAGYTYRGFIIGHPVGRDSRGYYLEVSRRFSSKFRATGFYNKEDHGLKVEGEEEVHEFGLDLKYKLNFMGERMELEGGGIFSRIHGLDLNTDPIRFTFSDRDENEWFAYIGVRWRW